MNSHNISKASSLDLGMNLMISKMASIIEFLKLNPPSSLNTSFKKFNIDLCLSGNFNDRVLMASITMILNSSEMSSMNPLIVLTNLSTFSEFPVFNRVVIAYVDTDLFESLIKDSSSRLHTMIFSGLFIAILLRILTAAKRVTVLGTLSNV
ncbi:hypothetical protein OGAPHI_007450 [Ogataea philodendri]|uniref:Uncharacterized protein n=1 Tax=Ogataea philodendri TaxID=1378263 RepID=A0A9P8SZU7_9ASCO|nr:uncharacterized protein OGAPHI_007450 [Ogataea philodendri]KAH3660245.1 hypothetical protein OGAPHI_007450 [Ogataea philodendri]